MTQEKDDELERLLTRALRARHEPGPPSNLAARASALAVAGTRPELVPAGRLVWLRRAQSLSSALAAAIVLLFAVNGLRVWWGLATSAAQGASPVASSGASGELGLAVGLSCLLGAVAVLALERAFSTDGERSSWPVSASGMERAVSG
jgi:hypothetical protein